MSVIPIKPHFSDDKKGTNSPPISNSFQSATKADSPTQNPRYLNYLQKHGLQDNPENRLRAAQEFWETAIKFSYKKSVQTTIDDIRMLVNSVPYPWPFSKKARFRSFISAMQNEKVIKPVLRRGHMAQAKEDIATAQEYLSKNASAEADRFIGLALEQCKKGGWRLEEIGYTIPKLLALTSDDFKKSEVGRRLVAGSYTITHPSGRPQVVIDSAIFHQLANTGLRLSRS